MSSNDASKRRKVATDNNFNGSEGQTAATGLEDIIAEKMQVHMTHMQNEMDVIKKQNLSMQNEIDSMKHRISEMDELKKENLHLKAKRIYTSRLDVAHWNNQ